ncbi:MAG: PEP-CTERM sorting domain-containing protein [Burkholderiaceae bacterium]|nr:PEP-CTERM sorting domain-containing protein [Burkholderiaceae bacterium]
MNPKTRMATILTTAAAVAPPLQAASFSIDSFGASATSVKVGDTVDFWVQFSASTTSNTYGGSNPYEPEPAEGYQEWHVNWYYWEHETFSSVSLQAGGQGFYDAPGLAPGSGYGNTWSFSVTFNDPGQHSIDLSGSWEAMINSGASNESAYRNCWYADPDTSSDLTCDWWTWSYHDYDDYYTTGDSITAGPLTINVSAVPEPGTFALWLAGIGLVAAGARRRR